MLVIPVDTVEEVVNEMRCNGETDLRSLIGRFEFHEDAFETEHGKGEWIIGRSDSRPTNIFVCTACHGLVIVPTYRNKCLYKFCPECGAKMKETCEEGE